LWVVRAWGRNLVGCRQRGAWSGSARGERPGRETDSNCTRSRATDVCV